MWTESSNYWLNCHFKSLKFQRKFLGINYPTSSFDWCGNWVPGNLNDLAIVTQSTGSLDRNKVAPSFLVQFSFCDIQYFNDCGLQEIKLAQ